MPGDGVVPAPGRDVVPARLTAAQQTLVALNYRRARRLSRWLRRKFPDADPADVRAFAEDTLLAAVCWFDATRGSFASFLHWTTRGRISRYRVAWYRVLRARRARTASWSEVGDRPGRDPGPERVDAADFAATALRRLSKRQADVVWRHYGLGDTLRDIAQDYGVTKQSIQLQAKAGLARLQEIYGHG